MGATRKIYWWYSLGADELEGRVETCTSKQRVTAGFLCPEKDIAALAASVCTQPEHVVHGTCLHVLLPWEQHCHLLCHLGR